MRNGRYRRGCWGYGIVAIMGCLFVGVAGRVVVPRGTGSVVPCFVVPSALPEPPGIIRMRNTDEEEATRSPAAVEYMRRLEARDRSSKRQRRSTGYLEFLQRRPARSLPPESSYPSRNRTRTAWTIVVRSTEDGFRLVKRSGEQDDRESVDPSQLRRDHYDHVRRVGVPAVKKSSTGAFEASQPTDYNFTRIGGYDHVKTELLQITDFMKHPEKYAPYNVRLPRGVLLFGEPGTGKTLFARCLAGECNLSFIATSGSEFQEKYVGVGPARIRELFAFAREQQPCIIFIDEIDGVARSRSSDADHAQAERDTTLNQLLVEMDGFRENHGIMVLASTNREDILDPAILRPGRMDKRVFINAPNYETRQEIAAIHLDKKPINVTADTVARITVGYTGAQIENLLNDLSLYGIRYNLLPINETVLQTFYEGHASPTTAMTPLNFSQESLWRIAVHEMGHVLTAFHADHHENPSRCTIASPNGRTAGYTVFEAHAPRTRHSGAAGEDDKMLMTKEYMMDRLCILFGGRVAEEMVFGSSVSSGAKHDLQMILAMAHTMVTELGMGRRIVYSPLSDVSKQAVDEDITRIAETAYGRARSILEDNKGLLRFMARHLVDARALDQPTLAALILEYAALLPAKHAQDPDPIPLG